MHINMASQAVREHFQLPFVVRLTMALPAVRDFAMLLMAFDTVNLSVFARCPLPFTINLSMTAITGLNLGIAGKTNP